MGHTQGAKNLISSIYRHNSVPWLAIALYFIYLSALEVVLKIISLYISNRVSFFLYSTDSISYSVKLKPIKANFGFKFNTNGGLLKTRCM